MKHIDLKVGDTVPLDYKRGITGRKLDKPVWHPLRVAPGKELAATGILKRHHGIEAFVPTEDRQRTVRGQRITRTFPQVTQIVYAKFHYAPNWDVMRERRIITGVFCTGCKPIILTPDTIRIVRGLPTKAEELAAAREELLRVNAGERVRLVSGPFEGMEVDVTQAADRKVWWAVTLANGMPLKGEVSRDDVSKIGKGTTD